VALVELGHAVVDLPFHQPNTHQRLSAKVTNGVTSTAGTSGHQVGPCIRSTAIQVKPGVHQHARGLDRQELRLGLAILGPLMTLEAPPAVEKEADRHRHGKGDHHRQHRPHDIGRQRPVDGGVEQGRAEPDQPEADQLPDQLAAGDAWDRLAWIMALPSRVKCLERQPIA
jgi:hypothetical protein